MTIQQYFGDWSKVIDLAEADRIIKKLSVSKAIICPSIKNIFLAFHLCSLSSLRVVILGQDPYPNLKATVLDASPSRTPVATGLAFANSADTPESSYSPSLEVLRESVIDYTIPHRTINFDPSLEKWEKQGVLLLNSALTCQTGRVGSHVLLWLPFMQSFLTSLSKVSWGVVYVLMGSQAQGLAPFINKRSNHILTCRHPAWFARNRIRMPPDIWQQANSILISQNGYGIEWYQES